MQPETQPCLGGQDEIFLAGESGHRRTNSGAYWTADLRSLAARGNRPDEGAPATTATDQREIALLVVSTVAADGVRLQFIRCLVHLQRVQRQPELRHAS